MLQLIGPFTAFLLIQFTRVLILPRLSHVNLFSTAALIRLFMFACIGTDITAGITYRFALHFAGRLTITITFIIFTV